MTCTHTIRDRLTGLTVRHYAYGRRVVTSGVNPWATVQIGEGPARVLEAATQKAAVELAAEIET